MFEYVYTPVRAIGGSDYYREAQRSDTADYAAQASFTLILLNEGISTKTAVMCSCVYLIALLVFLQPATSYTLA